MKTVFVNSFLMSTGQGPVLSEEKGEKRNGGLSESDLIVQANQTTEDTYFDPPIALAIDSSPQLKNCRW